MKEPRQLLAIDAVNPKDKTITIRIKLGHNNKTIRADVNYFLKLLREEADYFNVNLKSPKAQTDKYERCFRVYDLHEEEGRGWDKIAFEVYKDEVKSEKDLAKAREKVRKQYDRAKELINGGWQQI
jgi:hypothetical protein